MKTPIKITLQRYVSAVLPDAEYRITRLCRAITVDADKRINLKVGDTVTSKEAEQLCRCRTYEVTVTA